MLDRNLQLESGRSLSVAAGTYVSTDTIDLGVNRDAGRGTGLDFLFAIGTAVTGLTSLTFQIITSANANLSTPTVLASTAAIPLAQLTAGAQFVLPYPPHLPSQPLGQRYLGVQAVVAGTGTGGTWSCWLAYQRENIARRIHSGGYVIA